LVWSQVLAIPPVKLVEADLRRLAGLTPAAADELLVCPTAAGLVVAVDPVRQQLVWGYEYPSLEQPTLQHQALVLNRMNNRPLPVEVDESEGRWLDSAPTIAAGRVLLTPRDSSELHCLDVLTGELQWKRPRERGLYVAGVRDGRVLIVGRSQLELLDLSTGQPLWPKPLEITEPAGRGLLLADRYLLPQLNGQVAIIVLETGVARMQVRLPGGRMPGHLVAGQGALVSQSPGELLAYRPLPEIERQVATALIDQPEDPAALALQGELLLYHGDDEAGRAALRQAVERDPQSHASLLLADQWLRDLRTDFPADPAVVAAIETRIHDPHQRREFLWLTGTTWAARGDHLAAARQFLKLSDEQESSRSLVRLSGQHAVRRDRMIQGRVRALYDAASPADQQTLRAELAARWNGIDPSSVAAERRLRDFAGLPGTAEIERDRLRESRRTQNIIDATGWFPLAEHRDPAVSAPALASLAQDALDRNFPEAAEHWLTRLEREHPQTPVEDADTAAVWVARQRPELEQLKTGLSLTWPAGPWEPDRRSGNTSTQRSTLVEVVGTPHPIYRDWLFEYVAEGGPVLLARNGSGVIRWRLVLPLGILQNQNFFNMGQPAPRLFVHGDLFALSLGTDFIVFDAPNFDSPPRHVWSRALTTTPANPWMPGSTQVRVDFMRGGRRRVRTVDTESDQHVGELIGVNSTTVCYRQGSRVIAADPRTGQSLWIRFQVPTETEGFMDADHVVLLDNIAQEATILRAVDGELVAKTKLPEPHAWLACRGTRLLILARDDASPALRELDLLTGTVRWEQPLLPNTRCGLIDETELFTLDAAGNWRILDAETGRERASGSAPRVPQLDYVWVQRERGGYLVVAGTFAPGDRQDVMIYDGNQVPLAGVVFRLELPRKQPVWKADLEPTAFHVLQSPSVPILSFAGRRRQTVDPAGGPQRALPMMLSATFIDRRSGEVLYQTTESPVPPLYRTVINGGQSVVADFLTFSLTFGPIVAETPVPNPADP
jgi:outer membrane protein assembly factor BamB